MTKKNELSEVKPEIRVKTREQVDELIKKALTDTTGNATARLLGEVLLFAHEARTLDIHL